MWGLWRGDRQRKASEPVDAEPKRKLEAGDAAEEVTIADAPPLRPNA
jgi:hypothetical protein